MPLHQHWHQFLQDDITIQFNDRGALGAKSRSGSGARTSGTARTKIFGTAGAKFTGSRSDEGSSGAEDRAEEHQGFAGGWNRLGTRPEAIAQIAELLGDRRGFHPSRSQVHLVKLGRRIRAGSDESDRTNHPRIRGALGPRLVSFKDCLRVLGEAGSNLKSSGNSRQFAVEIRSEPIRSGAQPTLHPFALGRADLANPSILKNCQRGEENQQKTNQEHAGLWVAHKRGLYSAV